MDKIIKYYRKFKKSFKMRNSNKFFKKLFLNRIDIITNISSIIFYYLGLTYVKKILQNVLLKEGLFFILL